MKTKEQYLEEVLKLVKIDYYTLTIYHKHDDNTKYRTDQVSISVFKNDDRHNYDAGRIESWINEKFAEKCQTKTSVKSNRFYEFYKDRLPDTPDYYIDVKFLPDFYTLLPEIGFKISDRNVTTMGFDRGFSFTYEYTSKNLEDLCHKAAEFLSIEPTKTIKKFKDFYE